MGWFDIANQADLLIALDTVQFDKRSWQQRNRIRTSQGLQYITVPVYSSGRYTQKIMDVEIAEENFADRFLKTLALTYGRAPFYDDVIVDIQTALRCSVVSNPHLADLNLALINVLLRWLDIKTKIIRASDLSSGGERSDYLARLCAEVGADEYISTSGALDYLKNERNCFDERNIAVYIHTYEHPEYKQLYKPFMPFASSLDLIMMHGSESGEILKNANREIYCLGQDFPVVNQQAE
jgi:hypothetical protein